MSEEERTIEIKTIATYKDKIVRVDKLLQYLFEENQKYKEVIDKAINYIEENCYEHYDSYNDQQYYILESKKELLEILKEVK